MTVRQGLMISHRKYTTIDNQVTKHKILSKKTLLFKIFNFTGSTVTPKFGKTPS